MDNRYGPNTKQVERFLQRVATLTPAEREDILTEGILARSAFGDKDNHMVQVAAVSMYGKDHEEHMLGPASERLQEVTGVGLYARHGKGGYGHDFYFLALSALMGLVLCETMEAPEFAAWYGPFARVIPIESLGEGLAPPTPPAPGLGFQMLLTRLRNMREWGRIVEVHDMLMSAVGGPERHRIAIDAVVSLLQEPPADEFEEYRDAALATALDEIEVLGSDNLEKRIEHQQWLKQMIHKGMRRDGVPETEHLGDPNALARWASEERTRGQPFLEQFRHCCRDGVLAVASFTKVPDEHFYYLYLPFEAFIPVDSILP